VAAGPWQISYDSYIGGLTESVELDEGFYQHRILTVTYHDIECAYELRARQIEAGSYQPDRQDPPFVNAKFGG